MKQKKIKEAKKTPATNRAEQWERLYELIAKKLKQEKK